MHKPERVEVSVWCHVGEIIHSLWDNGWKVNMDKCYGIYVHITCRKPECTSTQSLGGEDVWLVEETVNLKGDCSINYGQPFCRIWNLESHNFTGLRDSEYITRTSQSYVILPGFFLEVRVTYGSFASCQELEKNFQCFLSFINDVLTMTQHLWTMYKN